MSKKRIKRTLVCLGVAVLFIGASFMSSCKKADETAAPEGMTQDQTTSTQSPAAAPEKAPTPETTPEGTSGSGN